MIVAAHQPGYLVWLGLLEKIALADRFVLLDNVQYNKRAFQHRTLYSMIGGAKYLSLSVKSKGHQTNSLRIKDVELQDLERPIRHFETLRHRYARRPGWVKIEDRLAAILLRPPASLLEINVLLLKLTLELFEIETPMVCCSELNATGHKGELMLSATAAAGGDTYLSGVGARNYMSDADGKDHGVRVVWQDFLHPRYKQSHGDDFQAGCFAMEWIIEDPDNAVRDFHTMVEQSLVRVGVME